MGEYVNIANAQNEYYVSQLSEINNKVVKIEFEIANFSKIEKALEKINDNFTEQNKRLTSIEIEQAGIKERLPARVQWFQVTTGLSAVGAMAVAIVSLLQ